MGFMFGVFLLFVVVEPMVIEHYLCKVNEFY